MEKLSDFSPPEVVLTKEAVASSPRPTSPETQPILAIHSLGTPLGNTQAGDVEGKIPAQTNETHLENAAETDNAAKKENAADTESAESAHGDVKQNLNDEEKKSLHFTEQAVPTRRTREESQANTPFSSTSSSHPDDILSTPSKGRKSLSLLSGRPEAPSETSLKWKKDPPAPLSHTLLLSRAFQTVPSSKWKSNSPRYASSPHDTIFSTQFRKARESLAGLDQKENGEYQTTHMPRITIKEKRDGILIPVGYDEAMADGETRHRAGSRSSLSFQTARLGSLTEGNQSRPAREPGSARWARAKSLESTNKLTAAFTLHTALESEAFSTAAQHRPGQRYDAVRTAFNLLRLNGDLPTVQLINHNNRIRLENEGGYTELVLSPVLQEGHLPTKEQLENDHTGRRVVDLAKALLRVHADQLPEAGHALFLLNLENLAVMTICGKGLTKFVLNWIISMFWWVCDLVVSFWETFHSFGWWVLDCGKYAAVKSVTDLIENFHVVECIWLTLYVVYLSWLTLSRLNGPESMLLNRFLTRLYDDRLSAILSLSSMSSAATIENISSFAQAFIDSAWDLSTHNGVIGIAFSLVTLGFFLDVLVRLWPHVKQLVKDMSKKLRNARKAHPQITGAIIWVSAFGLVEYFGQHFLEISFILGIFRITLASVQFIVDLMPPWAWIALFAAAVIIAVIWLFWTNPRWNQFIRNLPSTISRKFPQWMDAIFHMCQSLTAKLIGFGILLALDYVAGTLFLFRLWSSVKLLPLAWQITGGVTLGLVLLTYLLLEQFGADQLMYLAYQGFLLVGYTAQYFFEEQQRLLLIALISAYLLIDQLLIPRYYGNLERGSLGLCYEALLENPNLLKSLSCVFIIAPLVWFIVPYLGKAIAGLYDLILAFAKWTGAQIQNFGDAALAWMLAKGYALLVFLRRFNLIAEEFLKTLELPPWLVQAITTAMFVAIYLELRIRLIGGLGSCPHHFHVEVRYPEDNLSGPVLDVH